MQHQQASALETPTYHLEQIMNMGKTKPMITLVAQVYDIIGDGTLGDKDMI
jgi:hypothetical protein